MQGSLAHELKKYTASEIYPFHMPGHKRNLPARIREGLERIEELDLTELEESDNLHDPKGIIKAASEYAAEVYGAEKSYFLINGSSCGILAAIAACAGAREGGRLLLMAENAHICAYHALEITGARAEYIPVKKIQPQGIDSSVDPQEIKERLESLNIKGALPFALYLTSPSYEGVVSDIESIAKISHDFGLPLIVDEAHGAHLCFFDRYGETGIKSALDLGADIVVQSLHKTLPALTQTAILHLNSKLVEKKSLEHMLRVFQSSSPSYILLSSIDLAVRYMQEKGREPVRRHLSMLEDFRAELSSLKHIEIWEAGEEVYRQDPSKLVITVKKSASGEVLEAGGALMKNILKAEAGIELEMAARSYALAITSICDTKEGLQKLKRALFALDRCIEQFASEKIRRERKGETKKEEEENRLRAMEGRKVREYIYAYPPGIPILKPGEYLDKKKREEISAYIKEGIQIIGI